MKLYLGDLHIGYGTTGDDFKHDEKLCNILNEAAAESKELFILGDFLELYDRNETNVYGDVREYIRDYDYSIVDEIYSQHKKVFESIQKLSEKKQIKYIIGNHDYYLLFDEKLRNKVKKIIGNVEFFPYYYDEEYMLFLIHGNQFDTTNRFCYDGENIMPSFGELLLRHMKGNFDDKLCNVLPEELLSDYDNIMPLLDVFEWLEYTSEKYKLNYDLKDHWVDSFINLIRKDEVKKWLKINFPKYTIFTNLFVNKFGGMDLGERIVRTIMFFRKFGSTNGLLKRANGLLKNEFFIPKKYNIGFSEQDIYFPEEKIKGLIMGHNHMAGYYEISAYKKKKFYANTGAWKHVVKKNSGIDYKEFIRKNIISYLEVFEDKKQIKTKLYLEELY